MEKRIHVRDLAPFASSEDLSDERESPLDEEKQKSKLPHIEEEMKESSKINLTVTNVAPRIDISRASSSSHQEDSSPERELILGEGGKGSKLEVAFGEEIASDLHSSTEELSFQDPAEAEKYKKKKQSQTFSDLQNETLRKDSGCSDIALLSISGRTSRVSSVGSVASGGSGISNYSAVSHCSARSHLSATSNLSKASRCSSPHRMSLETSFCGPKPVHSVSLDVDETVKSIADKLSYKTEQVETTVKDSITEKSTPKSKKVSSYAPKKSSNSKPSHSRDHSKSSRKKPSNIENPKTQKFVSLHSDEEEEPIASKSVNTRTNTNPNIDNRTQIFIPLHGDPDEQKICEPNPNSPKRLKPFTNTTLVNFISKYDTEGNIKRERRSTMSETRSDYHPKGAINEEFQKFISLKDDDDDGSGRVRCTPKHRRSVSNIATSSTSETKPTNQIVVPIQVYQAPTTEAAPEIASSPDKPKSDLPKYLMTSDGTTQYIPLRGSDSHLQTRQSNTNQNNYLSVNKNEIKSLSDDRNLSHLSPLISPNLGRHNKPSNLELSYREHPTRSAKSMTQLINRDESRTPSPNASASNHNRLYRRCSESAKEIRNIEKPKSRSGSIKSLFSSFFKRSGSARAKKTQKSETSRSEIPDPKITNVEFTFKQPAKSKEPVSIIIPLHSDDELTPTDVKCYGDHPKKELKKDKPSISETKTNISDKIEKSIPSTSSSPKTKTVSYAENLQKRSEPESGKREARITCKKETVKEIRIVQKTSILSSPEVEKKIEMYKLECEVTVHNEASTPTESRQADIQKNVEKSDEIWSKVDEKKSTLNVESDADLIKASTEESDTTEHRKKMSKHEVDGEEGDISTDSDRVTLVVAESEEEHKTLVNTSESFEEELLYVPTTLPLERSVAVPIVPIKERVIEIRTQSVDRPRSVTPLNPALLENYVTSLPSTVTSTDETSTTEKLHITLPRTDAATDVPKKKSPLIKKKTWQNFIEHDLQSPKRVPKVDTTDTTESPSPSLQSRKSMSWVSFDESSHETRQSPKRITTLPSSYGVESTVADVNESKYGQRIVFVNPDECACECHETQHGNKSFQKQ